MSLTTLLIQYKWSLAVTSTLGYIVALCIYRRFFHPLANIPGPFLPAVTKFYQSAYNGRFYKEVDRLHGEYGPVVRITPNEIHLSDPQNYDKIYYVGSKYEKSPNFYNALCAPASSFGAITNEVHRIRRGAMNPMFSRKMVLDLEGVVQDKARKVCQRVQIGLEAGTPVDLHHIFRAVSMDVISAFAFNKCYDFLDKEDLGAYFFRMARGIGPALWVFQQFASLQALALKIPPWLAPILSEPLGCVVNLQQTCMDQVDDVRKKMKEDPEWSKERPTIFSTLLSEEDKPEGYSVPSTWDLKDEAYSVLVAAADTTGNAMTIAAFNVMNDQNIYSTLVRELAQAFPDPNQDLDFMTLEKLPYLTGVIKEALRLSFGVIGRLPRVVPEPGATYNDYYVPAGTVVSMSSWMMHRNAEFFPDPMAFRPERWLDINDFRRLDKLMVPFGRGSRQCVGMPLAYCELYLTLGTLFRRFQDLKVYKTTKEDLEYEDFFSSYHVEGKNWLKAVRAS